MSEQPILYDLYCKAGGAARGHMDAGFEVWGVDRDAQPHYCGARFIRSDALAFIEAVTRGEYPMPAAWHASPPCQTFTAYRRRGDGVGDGYEDLIAQTRDLLDQTDRLYVIENIPGAPLRNPIQLCGSSFGLDVRRHRRFETNWPVGDVPACNHPNNPRFPQATNRTNLRSTVEIGVWRIPLDVQQRAMGGLDWMTREELSEAIPPAYTRWIGERLLRLLRALAPSPGSPDGREGEGL